MMMIQPEQDTVVDYAQSVSMRVIAPAELIDVISDLTDTFVDTVNNGSPLGFMPPITRDMARDYWISLLPELRSARRLLNFWYKALGYTDVGVIPGWTIGPNGERYDHVSMFEELRTAD